MKKIFLIMSFIMCVMSLQASPSGIIRKAIEVAAKVSGKTLSNSSRRAAQKSLTQAFRIYGDDVLRTVQKGGLEAIKAGEKYGDDFWRLTKNAPPAAIRSLALNSEKLMPIAARMGKDFMVLEGKAPGLGARVVAEFGDDAAKKIAKTASADDISKLCGYARKADSPATKKMLLEKYLSGGSQFLNNLSWKKILATGLSAAAITSAYKISNGIEHGIETTAEKEPKSFVEIVSDFTAPFKWGIFFLLLFLIYPVFKLVVWLSSQIKLPEKTTNADDPVIVDAEIVIPEIVSDDQEKTCEQNG